MLLLVLILRAMIHTVWEWLTIPVLGKVVHRCELNHSSQDEGEGDPDVDVQCSSVGHTREVTTTLQAQECHG